MRRITLALCRRGYHRDLFIFPYVICARCDSFTRFGFRRAIEKLLTLVK